MRFLLVISILFVALFSSAQPKGREVRTLIIIFDGLRPDYITPEFMPHLYSLKNKGTYATKHHSVFPTVTRLNASSYSTGSYPATHGLLGNTVYFPEVDSQRGLDTGDANELMRIATSTNNKLLTAISLGELLQRAGEKMMVFSSGSSGQAFLQNHTVSGGAIINPEVILPTSMEAELREKIGAAPPSAEPNIGQHEWATRALLEYGLKDKGPLVSAIWYSDPDGTAHSQGMGHPLTKESLKAVDAQLGIIIKELQSRKLIGSYNIIVTADHGFVTHTGTTTVSKFLRTSGLKKSDSSDDVIVVGNALYVKNHDRNAIRKIVTALQEQPWIGAIFTSAGDKEPGKGWVDGTLSFESIHWDHERSADILVDYNWNDSNNAFGYNGTSFSSGVAGHGGASPYEIHIPLILSGPGFRTEYVSDLPTSNIDIVPTILHLYNLEIPSSMNGRVMTELCAGASKSRERLRREIIKTSVKHAWGTYKLILQRSIVGPQQYVDFTKVERTREKRK